MASLMLRMSTCHQNFAMKWYRIHATRANGPTTIPTVMDRPISQPQTPANVSNGFERM